MSALGQGPEAKPLVAALARAWLDKIESARVRRGWTDNPAPAEEAALLQALVRCGHMDSLCQENSYAESQSIEHGVAHVHVWTGGDRPEAMFWLEIDPTTGEVRLC